MSVSNEALQKILQEIGQKKAFAEQQLLIVKQQKAAKTRETRMLQLTVSEIDSLPKETKVFEGVGKMFVGTPIQDVQKRLEKEGVEVKAEISNLDKKEDYLQKTYENSKNSLEQDRLQSHIRSSSKDFYDLPQRTTAMPIHILLGGSFAECHKAFRLKGRLKSVDHIESPFTSS